MKKYIASLLALAFCIVSCEPNFGTDDTETEVDNPSIELSTPASVNSDYTAAVYDIDVNANTNWVISRTDTEGNAIDWVKFTALSGKGACSIQMKVTENPDQAERAAVITFECGRNAEAKAYIDIRQAANPNEPQEPEEPDDPEPPTPEGPTEDVFNVSFDFTGQPQDGWATSKAESVYPNGGTEVAYTLNGTQYMFRLATCNVDAGSTSGPYWVAPAGTAPGYLSSYAQYRYIGVPVIAGYYLHKVVVEGGKVSLSSAKPKFCITNSLAANTGEAGAINDESACVVSGGGYQELEADGTGTLTYTLSGTEVGKQYFIYGRVKGAIGSIALTYVKEGVTPPGGETDPPQETKDPIVLDIDFTAAPEGWPTSKNDSWASFKGLDSGLAADNGGTATENKHRRALLTYKADDKEYDFMFADCDEAPSHNVYISVGKGLYVGTYRYVGFPAVAGYKLTQIVTVQNASTKDSGWRPVGISSTIGNLALEGINYIAGGETQCQDTNLGEYTYNLTASEPGVMYYIYCAKNASIFKSMKLTYTPVQ